MSSNDHIEANRRNSQLSTGPRTPEGKPRPVTGTVSRLNALKSGINVKTQVIPGEDPADLEAMVAGYQQEWAPTTYLERFFVDSLIRADWLLQRFSRVEAELWAHHIQDARTSAFHKLDENAPVGDIYSRKCDCFALLQRRMDSTERSYYRALTQLQRLRRNTEDADVPAAEPSPEFLPSAPPASDPLPAPTPAPQDPAAVPDPLPAGLASFRHQSSRSLCARRQSLTLRRPQLHAAFSVRPARTALLS